MQGALPAARQRDVERLTASLSWVGVPARWPNDEVRAVIELAWLRDAPMRIVYDGAKGHTERTVRVQSVVLERTMTLLNCQDLDIDDSRQFIMHKILRAELANNDVAT